MVRAISHYPWSSYRATLGQADRPDWLSTDWILAQFAKGRAVKSVMSRLDPFYF